MCNRSICGFEIEHQLATLLSEWTENYTIVGGNVITVPLKSRVPFPPISWELGKSKVCNRMMFLMRIGG